MSFENKVVIVTGASSGIGAETAITFSKEGARVVIVGRNEAKLEEVADECVKPLVIRADLSNEEDAKRIIDETMKTFGCLDVLVNNAGHATVPASLLEGDLMKSFDTIMSVNLRAVVHLTKLAAPHLIKSKGNVINISSVAGSKPLSAVVINYSISKAALNHFTTCAASELGPHGVRVNGISPGPVKTNITTSDEAWEYFKGLTLLKRVSESKEIADMIMYLASDKAVGITGSNFVIDNGMMLKRQD